MLLSNLTMLVLFSILYTCWLTYLYFSKIRINNNENKLYKVLLIANLFGLILQLLCDFVSYKFDIVPAFIREITFRLYVAYFIFWVNIMLLYLLELSFPNNKKKYNRVMMPLTAMQMILVFSLPYNLYRDVLTRTYYTYGMAIEMTFIISGIICLIMGSILIVKRETIPLKKSIPIYIFIACGLIAALVQKINPDILIITSMESFICFLMYFTIENPDLQIIEEYREIKNIAEKQNIDKVMFLYNVNQKMKYSLQRISSNCNYIYDSNDVLDIKDCVKDIDVKTRELINILINVYDPNNINENKVIVYNDNYNTKIYENVFKSFKNITDKKIEFTYQIDYNLPNYLYGDILNTKEVLKKIYSNVLSKVSNGYIDINLNVVIRDNICRLIIEITDNGEGYSYKEIEESLKCGILRQFSDELKELNGTYIINSNQFTKTSNIIVFDQQINNKDKQKIKELENITNKKRTMIVDDSDDSIEIIKMLEKENNIVEHYKLGTDCLNKVRAYEKYDLIIINDKIEPISGINIFNKLNENMTFKTPVIMLSNKKDFRIKELYLKNGIKDIIAIPFEKDSIVIINKYLDK